MSSWVWASVYGNISALLAIGRPFAEVNSSREGTAATWGTLPILARAATLRRRRKVTCGRKALTCDHYTSGYGKTRGEGVVRHPPEADRSGVRVHREAGQVVRPAARRGGADPAGTDRAGG